MLPPPPESEFVVCQCAGRWNGATAGAKSLRRKDRNAAADRAERQKKTTHHRAHREGGGRDAARGGHVGRDHRVRSRVVWIFFFIFSHAAPLQSAASGASAGD